MCKEIIISAGHDFDSPGASVAFKTSIGVLNEYFLNSAITYMIWDRIKNNLDKDIQVYIVGGELASKMEKIKKLEREHNISAVFENHFNKSNGLANGLEILYHPYANTERRIQAEKMTDVFDLSGIPTREPKRGFYQLDYRNEPLYFLQSCKSPAFIIEWEFMDYKHRIAWHDVIQEYRTYIDAFVKCVTNLDFKDEE